MTKEIQNQIEAILFASGKGVSIQDICKICDISEKIANQEIKKLKEDYSIRDSGLLIDFINDKWKISIKGKYVPHIEKLVSETELAPSVLKTLAVVAFKTPVLQSEIIDMRGQGAYDHINQLAKEGFLTKESHGRSFILKITEKFYNYFDVEGDEEIREVFAKLKESQQEKLGELEVVEIEKHKKKLEEKEKQSKLDVVDIPEAGLKDHNTIFDDEVINEEKEKIIQEKNEEKQKENEFLSKIDSQIEEISKKLNQKDEEEKNNQESNSEVKNEDLKPETEVDSEEKEEENYL